VIINQPVQQAIIKFNGLKRLKCVGHGETPQEKRETPPMGRRAGLIDGFELTAARIGRILPKPREEKFL
jgi:hypothetical protein